MAHVLTLTGPSISGKSTVIKDFLTFESDAFVPRMIAKFTTRPARDNEKGTGRTKTSVRETISVEKLPVSCDIVYEQYGVRYGLHSRTLYDALRKGVSPIVILNDVRAVEDVRDALGGLVRSIFLFRTSPILAQHEELARQRGVRDEKTAEIRYRKAQSIYRIYIENIFMFDHVILNFGDRKDLRRQVEQIVAGISATPGWPMELEEDSPE